MLRLIKKGLQCLRENGWRYTWGKICQKLKKKRINKNLRKMALPPKELSEIRGNNVAEETVKTTKIALPPKQLPEMHGNNGLEETVKISILTPLYNTPMNFLNKMIDSVQAQTYKNWELCLCDGSDHAHKGVGNTCRALAKKDSRIKYRKLERNAGISENTNECIKLSSGEYLALLDHDDVLHPMALYEVVKAIQKQGADFIYTDEAKFVDNIEKFFDPNFKPDYAKDELRAHNYICHFTAYSRELLESAGYYRSEYDGSQDHDIVLRLTERANCIVHIPKILYFWRVHKDSVSAGVDVKSYAIDAARNAVADQLKRTQEIGKVSSVAPYQTLYKVDYELPEEKPMISVIIYGITGPTELVRCVNAVEYLTTYFPMEVCMIEGTMDRGTFKTTLRTIPTIKPIQIITREEQRSGNSPLNLAVEKCSGSYILFMHADAALDTHRWATELLMYAQRKDVGAVGGKVYDGNRAIYSAGIALDQEENTLIHHMYRGEPWGSHGYEAGLYHVRNVTAVDGQCLMVSKEKFLEAGGLNEEMGSYCFIDLCLKFREKNLLNVLTPFVGVMFWGNQTYGREEKQKFSDIWKERLSKPDPYYNPNIKKLMIY